MFLNHRSAAPSELFTRVRGVFQKQCPDFSSTLRLQGAPSPLTLYPNFCGTFSAQVPPVFYPSVSRSDLLVISRQYLLLHLELIWTFMSPSVQKKKIKDTWDESLPVFFFVFFYLLSQRRRWNAVSFYRPTIVKLFMGHLKTLIVASVISHSLDTVGERTPPPAPPRVQTERSHWLQSPSDYNSHWAPESVFRLPDLGVTCVSV